MKALGSYHPHWLRLAVQNIVGSKVPATTGAPSTRQLASVMMLYIQSPARGLICMQGLCSGEHHIMNITAVNMFTLRARVTVRQPLALALQALQRRTWRRS